jgi:2-polyprenyl-6-methoxyphenol hydroxylase-like FAD-dependent oxidoreductase
MIEMPTHVDVLIVGAGPVGLALAAALRRRGRSVLLIDQQAEGAHTSRAAVVHAGTLEALDELGATEPLLASGVRARQFSAHDHEAVLLTIDFDKIPSRYPFALMCPQDRTEAILLDRLHAFGGAVVRPCTLLDLAADEDGVTATLERDGRTHSVEARYVVGCDGVRSTVRDKAHIAIEGGAYPENFVLADVRVTGAFDPHDIALYLAADGMLLFAPLPDDRVRIVATVPEAPEHPSLATVQRLLDERTALAVAIAETFWTGRFHIHHRVAATMLQGQVVLCGDAAHEHSPAGGQGMNTGIQDAIALAGPLDEALAGGDLAALQTWANQRRRNAKRVVAMTDRMTRAATVTSTPARVLRNAAMRLIGHLPPARHAIATRLAEVDRRTREP